LDFSEQARSGGRAVAERSGTSRMLYIVTGECMLVLVRGAQMEYINAFPAAYSFVDDLFSVSVR